VRSDQIPANQTVRILLLEDNEADTELISRELRRIGMPAAVERVDSKAAFIAALDRFSPDVVVCDNALAQFDSQAALGLLRAARPATPFIIVTAALSGAQTGTAIRAGAEDVVLKADLRGLGASISSALAVRQPLQGLSRRQREVLRMIAEGHRTRDIANRLGLGVKTVESHRYALMKRLRVGGVVSLVRYAIRVGMIPLELERSEWDSSSSEHRQLSLENSPLRDASGDLA
jgi:DNA-binding NarL/FixJ family response regulator